MARRHLRAIAAGAVLVLLAACDSRPPADGTVQHPGPTGAFVAQTVATKDPGRDGPAPEVEGATTGGTLTVYLPGAPGPDTLDPAGGWSVPGNAILQALVSRSLTQYARGEHGEPVLVPDLATDLGRHNDDFTRWTFTIRTDATWEDGRPITAEEVAFGICRSLDAGALPAGPGAEYSRGYFAGAEDYLGPYSDDDPGCDDWSGIEVDGQDITISMSRPFPDMDYYGASMAMGPAPRGKASDPTTYSHAPLASGPYEVGSWTPGEELVLVRNDEWSASSDPARHQYPQQWVFKFTQDQAVVDEIMLSGSTAGRAALSTSLGAGRYVEATRLLGERLVQQSTPCVASIAPDYTKITDVRVRKALAYAYPYQDAWTAGGDVPGVTRVLASSLLPPEMPGRRDYRVDGEQITYDPARSRALLAEAGWGDEPYPITMAYFDLDPQAREAQDQVTTGLEAGGFSVKAIPLQESPYNVWTDPDDEVNRTLDIRGSNWCPPWPTGAAMLPPLLEPGATYNTAHFEEPSVTEEMRRIATLPAKQQPDAWGELDETIMRTWFPIIPTGYVNRLFVFGDRVGNPAGDGSSGTPDYKDLYVVR